jgi:hypothetical protein
MPVEHRDQGRLRPRVRTELVIGTPHTSTHIDALCHCASDGRIFGGASVADVHTDFRFTEHRMETVPPILAEWEEPLYEASLKTVPAAPPVSLDGTLVPGAPCPGHRSPRSWQPPVTPREG